MNAIEQYFQVVLFVMLYKVVLTFKFVDETLVCDHSNESYRAVLKCNVVLYIMLNADEAITSVKSVDQTRACDHSNESY